MLQGKRFLFDSRYAIRYNRLAYTPYLGLILPLARNSFFRPMKAIQNSNHFNIIIFWSAIRECFFVEVNRIPQQNDGMFDFSCQKRAANLISFADYLKPFFV